MLMIVDNFEGCSLATCWREQEWWQHAHFKSPHSLFLTSPFPCLPSSNFVLTSAARTASSCSSYPRDRAWWACRWWRTHPGSGQSSPETRDQKHWQKFKISCVRLDIWDGHRLDLHGDVLLAIVHTHHAASGGHQQWVASILNNPAKLTTDLAENSPWESMTTAITVSVQASNHLWPWAPSQLQNTAVLAGFWWHKPISFGLFRQGMSSEDHGAETLSRRFGMSRKITSWFHSKIVIWW